MTDLVTINIQDHVADVRLNRPDKMNAINHGLIDAIAEAGAALAADKSVRVVVLSGEGSAFCAGLDVENFSGDSLPTDLFGDGRGDHSPNYFQAPAFVWKSIPVPVICALHGVAYGGGIQIALGADIRIAHPQTKMSIMEIKWGLIPDMSASQTLCDLVRLDVAKELTYTGRIFDAEEALRLGLVTSVNDRPYDAAMDMAAAIAQRNPDAIAMDKYLLENSWQSETTAGLRMEQDLQSQILGTFNLSEAVRSTMERRVPQFEERSFGTFADLSDKLGSE